MILRTSIDNPALDVYRQVARPDPLHARGLFVAEGRLVVRRLLPISAEPGHTFHDSVQSVLLTEAAAQPLADLLAAHPHVPAYVVSQAEMNEVAGFNIHRGCLAIARRPAAGELDRTGLAGARLVVVLEGVNNPDNVGGIFRSAAAFGVDLIVLGPHCADPLYRKSIRTAMGATLVVPFVVANAWPDAIGVLRSAGLRVLALTTDAAATRLADAAIGGTPTAVLAGAEGAGLSADALAAADVRVTIPMTGTIDSLNVTTATSIALYHLRQS